MADILAVDQDYDDVTRYGLAFRNTLVFNSFTTVYPKDKLYRSTSAKATRADIDAIIGGNSIKFVTAMGHGVYDTFTGQHGVPIWGASEDLSYLSGRIVHLLSCQTGAVLGRKMVQDGVTAFWGYTVSFAFFRDPMHAPDPSKDATAEVFLRMDAIIDRGILARRTSDQIYDSVAKYVAKVLPQLGPIERAVMLDNFVHLVCPSTTWGSLTATI